MTKFEKFIEKASSLNNDGDEFGRAMWVFGKWIIALSAFQILIGKIPDTVVFPNAAFWIWAVLIVFYIFCIFYCFIDVYKFFKSDDKKKLIQSALKTFYQLMQGLRLFGAFLLTAGLIIFNLSDNSKNVIDELIKNGEYGIPTLLLISVVILACGMDKLLEIAFDIIRGIFKLLIWGISAFYKRVFK